MTDQPEKTTTDAGSPIESDDHSLTAGPTGPTLLQDSHLIERTAQFNRERVPERVVHAKGGGAYGFFEVTEDVTPWCKADFLRPGTRTPVLARFSTVIGEHGSADTVRDPRGFAVKFFTREGNYDLVGIHAPVFFIRDAIKFADFIHSQKRMPDTGLRSNDAQWDFWTLAPESAHMVAILMSDRGTPRSWRTMHGYGNHTFMWVNASGERFWVKYHWKTVQGIDNFTAAEAQAMTAEDPDFHRRDLFAAIRRRDAPEWRLELQVMPFAAAAEYRFNPFDVTKVWPHGDYPPITVGRLVLDRNPENHFAEIEQAAFAPANMVPGIGPSPDKMLLGRLQSYPDAQRYRIGTNYAQLPANRPHVEVHNYNADGSMRYRHSGAQPTYSPNGYGGPEADPGFADPSWRTEAAEIGRYAYALHADDDDFVQARNLWLLLAPTEREHLVDNIVGHLCQDVSAPVISRAVAYWRSVDQELGDRVAFGISPSRLARSA
jgi:catalase